ncbi:LAME_0G12750g1_1 [Lachancea meyersii CBS 8951]|uniref:non-specific serine/threonine protein kinase n=1 Tax=Lachancea meyersii CBS 8951 TaxID=1266667 RepID=A0A1G4K9S3_9SACH|nr:LAME_0G12750g1_1 [Lachancea meyersii CBS 8951]
MNNQLPDIYPPGTALTVGSHRARIIKYLASGGFAHIYSAEISPADPGFSTRVACLKRVLVPDKPSLNVLRAEVDAMKLLRGNKHIVSYIDSHAAKSGGQNGSYEVFLLMELCTGGGLIDFMNTRLQNRFQEAEILKIMSDITQGITAMHALLPPLVHRDIKIENVLIAGDGTFKVCDFGSVCGIIRPPKNGQEFNYVQHDLLKNTTAQYRSPEMIDLYRGYPINEKSDIWALGVFLYKLCYYTTPFEKVGEAAILHSRFQFPAYPHYSDKLKNLISVMLSQNPIHRPNVCQVLEEVSRIQNVPCPLRNFYLLRSMQEQQTLKVQVSLPHSISQPKLDASQGIMKVKPAAGLTSWKTFTKGAGNEIPYEGQAQVIKPQRSRTSQFGKTSDPFMAIDKSRLLQDKISRLPATTTAGNTVHAKSLPATGALSSRRSESPAFAGRGDISMIVSANPTSIKPSSKYSSTGDSKAVPVLKQSSIKLSASPRRSEDLESQYTGDSFDRKVIQKIKKVFTGERRSISPIKSRQNTGESVKSSFATLRRGLSRGGSLKGDHPNKRNTSEVSLGPPPSNGHTARMSSSDSIEEERFAFRRTHSRSSSSASIISDLEYLEEDDTGANEYYRRRSPVRVANDNDLRFSIQKRVQELLKSSEESPVVKTAHGYGEQKVTEQKKLPLQLTNETLLQSIGESSLSTPKASSPGNRQSSVVITKIDDSSKVSPNISKKVPRPAHAKPKRPTKPIHLRGDKLVKKGGVHDNGNQQYLLEVEELEKDFRTRFPSAV